ncbi:MAG: sensor histidine kinase [Deltaproteobacteria bacterium]
MSGVDGLAEFIEKERPKIVADWEAFARTLLPAAGGMSGPALRDHADQILTAIIHDMKSRQSAAEQAEKSKGRGEAQHLGEIGQLHATLRIENGFKVGQLVAEYRALRASVLRLWEKIGTDPGGVTRFNESIDEALTEAVQSFTETTEHFRDQSLGILSHDLRNPLSAIVMGATLLMNSEELDDKFLRIVTRMFSSANRMGRMVADLLDLTRTRFGDRIPIVRATIDLDPLCRQVISELEGHRAPGDLRFTARGNLQGEWDGDRIAQVLSNLVSNAIQHGGKSDPIDVVASGNGDEVVLEVHNVGATIHPTALNTMFNPMVRHHGTFQTNAGLGLGLYIASQVMLAHGGTLEVTSTDADGTRFTAHLPRHVPETKT